MLNIKKTLAVILSLCFIASLSACAGGKNQPAAGGPNGSGISIICSVFPVYDWVKNIVEGSKEKADLTLLLDSGTDLHNFQPTADDIASIAKCDVFIYIGGESDDWVEDAVRSSGNTGLLSVNLMEELGSNAKEEELIEGMASPDEHGDEEEEEDPEYDEHIWLSVKNASILVNRIAEKLSEFDPDNSDIYSGNASAYTEKLSALDAEFTGIAENAKTRVLLFGDRFPFRYFTDDYGIKYYAAFLGCSAETEASFETVSFLASKVDELSLDYIITIEGTNHKIAETIIGNTKTKNQEILSLNSMQSITEKDILEGADYISIMESNAEVLRTAMS